MINLPILKISKSGDDKLLLLKKWLKEGQHQKTPAINKEKVLGIKGIENCVFYSICGHEYVVKMH